MRLLASLLASFGIALLTAAPAQAELVLAVNEGVTYYVTPSEIREKYKDLADLLGKHLKTTVRVVPVDQYPVLRRVWTSSGMTSRSCTRRIIRSCRCATANTTWWC